MNKPSYANLTRKYDRTVERAEELGQMVKRLRIANHKLSLENRALKGDRDAAKAFRKMMT